MRRARAGAALLPLPLPRRPGRTPRPPPRRRGGELAAEPRPSFSRAHEHYKYPSKPSLSLFRFSHTPTHRNTFAAPSISAAAPARTRSHSFATARPKLNSPTPSSCFTGTPQPDPLRCSSPEHHLHRRSSPPIAGARGVSASDHPEPRRKCPEVRPDLLFLFSPSLARRRRPTPPGSGRPFPAPLPKPAKGLFARNHLIPGTLQ